MSFVLVLLLLFLIVGSLVALEMKNLLSAVIAVGIVGLGLSIVFLLLGAPDIAITQVVVEVIVVTVLIRAAGRTQVADETLGPRRDWPALAVGGVVLAVLLVFTITAFLALPGFGEARPTPAFWYLENGPALTGASNVVTAVLLDFRAYDTLGEATVILTAIVGALVILRSTRKEERKSPPPVSEPDLPPEPKSSEPPPAEPRELVEEGSHV